MSSPVLIFVANTKQRAHQQAALMVADGFDVVVTGPVENLFAMTFEGDENGREVVSNPFPQMWVAFCFNKTNDDFVQID